MFRCSNKNSVVINRDNTVTDSYNSTLNIEINNGVQARDLQLLRQPVIGIKNRVEEISKRLDKEKRFQVLAWLLEVDYEQHHKFISSTRHSNTGNWLFQKRDFIEWKISASSIFWLHGIEIAEAGKTILASLALAYFYCKYGEIDRQEPQSILSTIVKQLSLMSPEGFLTEAVISLFEKQKKNGVKSRFLWLDESTGLISNLSRAFEQTIIIVDALDECNKETRFQLLDALKELRSSTEGLKIFITSRNDDDIRIELENESDVYIQPSDNSSDIKLFVVAEVEKNISKKRLLKGVVRPELKQRGETEPAIRQALKQLPKDLKATYSAIWDKIQVDTKENSRLAERILKLIICAISPLTVKEMLAALSITPME
ncbi:hypothetical protein RUND412_010606 [Rhizina undulata]